MKEYKIPEKYEKMITKELLVKIRDNIFATFEKIGMDTTADDGIDYILTTAGWGNAIKNACLELGKEDFYNYYENLEWMDSDIFDGILEDKMIEEKVILDNAINLYKEILNLDTDYCFGCYEIRDKKDLKKHAELGRYICTWCTERKDIKDYSTNGVEFKKILPKALNKIKTQEIIKCSKCDTGFYKYQGIIENGQFICNYCKKTEK